MGRLLAGRAWGGVVGLFRDLGFFVQAGERGLGGAGKLYLYSFPLYGRLATFFLGWERGALAIDSWLFLAIWGG